ncbi:MAG: hypothetical protein MUF52_00245 [Syntrophobacteraceae bacterium]|jgi:hypothetical protein|nr:hypothetical protein [Syntrophobacteraceae bacterium]
MEWRSLSGEERSRLQYTISHFKEIARQNRFAENGSIEHDVSRCVVCHADLVPWNPFITYLEVVTPSVLVRRPRLDQDLVDEINGDLSMLGEDHRVSIQLLRSGDAPSTQCWREWIQTALATGLGLLSIHSPTSLELDLDEAREDGMGDAIDVKILEIMREQLGSDGI